MHGGVYDVHRLYRRLAMCISYTPPMHIIWCEYSQVVQETSDVHACTIMMCTGYETGHEGCHLTYRTGHIGHEGGHAVKMQ